MRNPRSAAPLALALGVLGSLLLAAGAAAAQPPIKIPGPLSGPLAEFTGAAVEARPLAAATPPRNPALAAFGRSGSGLAAGNGGASPYPGPLGDGTRSISALQFGTCASLALDSRDRLLAVCNGPLAPSLRLLDPESLATIATLSLPNRPGPDRTDIAGGTHLIVRGDGTLLVPTHRRTLLEVEVGEESLTVTDSTGLAGLEPGERPFAVGAGFDGHDWVAGNQGTVLALARDGGPAQSIALGEPIAEDIATDPAGTFVVTTKALYRLRLGAGGIRVIWRQPIRRDPSAPDSGRFHEGSGTPPALLAGGLIAVADDRDPPRVGVYRVAGPAGERLLCEVPLFAADAGTVEAHLLAAGRSLVAFNAHGYESLATTEFGGTATGGIARVIVRRRGCRTAWTSEEISPSAQPVVSLATGLIYTLVKPAGFPDAWNLAAIDWRSGETRWHALAGEGLGHNSEGGAVIVGPAGAAYAGSFGGVTRFADR